MSFTALYSLPTQNALKSRIPSRRRVSLHHKNQNIRRNCVSIQMLINENKNNRSKKSNLPKIINQRQRNRKKKNKSKKNLKRLSLYSSMMTARNENIIRIKTNDFEYNNDSKGGGIDSYKTIFDKNLEDFSSSEIITNPPRSHRRRVSMMMPITNRSIKSSQGIRRPRKKRMILRINLNMSSTMPSSPQTSPSILRMPILANYKEEDSIKLLSTTSYIDTYRNKMKFENNSAKLRKIEGMMIQANVCENFSQYKSAIKWFRLVLSLTSSKNKNKKRKTNHIPSLRNDDDDRSKYIQIHSKALLGLARVSESSGNIKNALLLYRESILHEPLLVLKALYWNRIGNIHFIQKRWNKSYYCHKNAIMLKPEHKILILSSKQIATCLYHMGKYEASNLKLSDLYVMLENGGIDCVANLLERGENFIMMGFEEEALKVIGEALRLCCRDDIIIGNESIEEKRGELYELEGVCRHKLGVLLRNRKQFDMSEMYLESAMSIRNNIRENHNIGHLSSRNIQEEERKYSTEVHYVSNIDENIIKDKLFGNNNATSNMISLIETWNSIGKIKTQSIINSDGEVYIPLVDTMIELGLLQTQMNKKKTTTSYLISIILACKDTNHTNGFIKAKIALSKIYIIQSKNSKAIQILDSIISEYDIDKILLSQAYIIYGSIESKFKRYRQARVKYFSALDLCERSGDEFSSFDIFVRIAFDFSMCGRGDKRKNGVLMRENFREAISWYRRCVGNCQMIGNKERLAEIYQAIGECYFAIRDYDMAKKYYSRAEKVKVGLIIKHNNSTNSHTTKKGVIR